MARLAGGALLLLLAALTAMPAAAADSAAAKAKARQQALTQFEQAERAREALNGLSPAERTRRDYQHVSDAYRRVYYTAPSSSKADVSVVAVAELLAEAGRKFDDEKSLRSAIGQYEFLLREYPTSRYRFEALFTIGQIYEQDLGDNDQARENFQEFLKRFPHHPLAVNAKAAIAEIDKGLAKKHRDAKSAELHASDVKSTESKPAEVKLAMENRGSEHHGGLPLVTGIRHWSTPDYTRVAIDLEQEVKYEAGRVPDPDRIFFDLHDTKLASTLVGKTFDVSDGFLRRIRVAQYQPGLTRVVLEVDNVSDYSAFLLPNPYRLIIDIHARKPGKGPSPKADSEHMEKAEKSVEVPPVAVAGIKSEKPATPAATVPATATATPAAAAPSPASTPAPKAAEAKLPEAPSSVISHEPAKSAKHKGKTAEVAKDEELKATPTPTSEPTVAVVAPRAPEAKSVLSSRKNKLAESHQARPTAEGERSLTRALGLKIGKIVIDAGHGGHDTGTIGPDGLLEKDLVLDVALRLGRALEHQGFEVVYTRDDDTFVPLETRTAIANKAQADLFLSIHANSSKDATARGVETYYLNFTQSTDALEVAARENAVSDKSIHELQDLVKKITLKDKLEESREFASDVQNSLYGNLSARDKALKNRGVKKAPFIVLIGANMPSILAEISFVSNPTDEQRLQTPEYRQKIAEALYKGVNHYIDGLSGVKVSPHGKAEGQP
jgi:N-acetylmuramoyl-L-alanine amidase